MQLIHDDVIKWKHFPLYRPFVRGIHRSPVNSTHKDQWRGALMFSLICVWINGWVNNREAGDWRRYRTHYDVIVMNSTRSSLPYKLEDYLQYHFRALNLPSHHISIPFRVASLALGQSYDCPSASEVTLNNLVNIDPHQTPTTDIKRKQLTIFLGYIT